MFDFEYFAPTRVVFGKSAEEKTASLVKDAGGTRVLIHYGSESAVKSGLIEKIKKNLADADIFCIELGGVVPNPRLEKVREGIKICLENKIDFILPVGGGSVIDSAKAIAYGIAEPEYDVWELYAHTRKAKKSMPVGCVLTIAAAGSEMSSSSVITNGKTGEKRSYGSNLSRPQFAVMNPTLTMSLPAYQTASGCADIMMHTMERYFTQGGNMSLTDSIAEALLKTVMENALILVSNPSDYKARAEVMWASSLSHNTLTGCGNDGGDFASHKLEHELGGMYDVTHGAGLTAVWGHWARYVYKNNLPRFVKYAVNVMGIEKGEMSDEETALLGIEKTEKFFSSIGMPVNLRELGVFPAEKEISLMAKGAIAAAGGSFGSSVKLGESDIISIYKAAM